MFGSRSIRGQSSCENVADNHVVVLRAEASEPTGDRNDYESKEGGDRSCDPLAPELRNEHDVVADGMLGHGSNLTTQRHLEPVAPVIAFECLSYVLSLPATQANILRLHPSRL
jgi:hypothetical protein